MKVIGVGANNGRIVELTNEELVALVVRDPFDDPYAGIPVGAEVNILSRLAPTLKFEQHALSGDRMVEHLRHLADCLESGFSELRKR
jgi:hypothetical protein